MSSSMRRRHSEPAPNKLPDFSSIETPEKRVSTALTATFTGLPTEIHLLISKQLIYPDALSLKHTSRYFYSLVDTGVKLKVAWLMERRLLHLDCPNDRRCILRTDLEFCRGSVTYVYKCFRIPLFRPHADMINRLLMQRRREHVECESRPGLGCLVYGTPVCAHRRDWKTSWKRWMRRQVTIELWWILLAAIPLLLGWLWMAEFCDWMLSS